MGRLRSRIQWATAQAAFVGYPKSGNTWTRFLVGRYMQLLCGTQQMPLYDSHDWLGRCERAPQGPRMMFTHRPLEWSGQTAGDLTPRNVIAPFRGKKVVLIARYPLDVLVSAWFQQRFRAGKPFTGDLVAFLDNPSFGLQKLLHFHQIWADRCDEVDAFSVLRFEDLISDAAERLKVICNFLDIPVDESRVEKSVDFASFDNMKSLEGSEDGVRYRSSGLNVFATGDKANPDAWHMRRGKVGGYRDYLDPGTARAFEDRISTGMADRFGYKNPPIAA